MTQSPAQAVKSATRWSIILGALMMLLGIAAISLPLTTSLAFTIWIGWLLIGNSILKFIYAAQTREEGSFWVKLILAVLYLGAGVLLVVNPLEGVLTLTLLLGTFFVAEGLVELILAIQVRSLSNWGWVLFNAVLTLLLGIIVWLRWPLDAPWLIGTLVGVSFIASGLSRVMLSLAVRKVVTQVSEAS
ncbi:MAG: HdeD family acid-resistance protein [Leptolyngbya sp. SIO4C1]|nr:HdeD family acid-resistance protein [Leptolyngbya sp. SIO4C1]